MPPKAGQSQRPPAYGTAGSEWSSPRKTTRKKQNTFSSQSYGQGHSDYQDSRRSYAAADAPDQDRRRSYTLTLPGMEFAAPASNTYSTGHGNLHNGADQGDNKQQQPIPHAGSLAAMVDTEGTRGTSHARNAAPADAAAYQHAADQLAQELGQTGDDIAVPIGRETAAEFDPHAIWRMVLGELALQMPASTFDTWVRDTVVIGYEDGEFIIGMPNAYARDWLENRLRHTIKRSLSSIMHRAVQIQFRVRPRPVQESASAPFETAHAPLYQAVVEEPVVTNPTNSPNPAHHTAPRVAGPAHDLAAASLDAGDLGNEEHVEAASTPSPMHAQPAAAGAPHAGRERIDEAPLATQLNPYHNFETFVVGNHNRLAHAAALAIVDMPGQSFNPLFIYGGVGLGKTHLLNAIGNSLRQKGFRLIYCSSEQFTNELISSIRNQSTDQFRAKYRQADVLLIDDIQFIGGKESTQEEFFHTFNHLHAAGKQVVLSSDRPPKALPTLDDRLRSRFEGGLQTDIAQPDFETRVAILQSKANRMGVPVPYDVLLLVAERVDSNIRELEGALNRLSMQARLTNQTLNLALAKSLLENLAPQRLPCTPAAVVRIVAEHFGLRIEDLTGRKRTKEIANARQIAM